VRCSSDAKDKNGNQTFMWQKWQSNYVVPSGTSNKQKQKQQSCSCHLAENKNKNSNQHVQCSSDDNPPKTAINVVSTDTKIQKQNKNSNKRTIMQQLCARKNKAKNSNQHVWHESDAKQQDKNSNQPAWLVQMQKTKIPVNLCSAHMGWTYKWQS